MGARVLINGTRYYALFACRIVRCNDVFCVRRSDDGCERSRRQNKCLHALDYSVERCPTDNWQLEPRSSSRSIWQTLIAAVPKRSSERRWNPAELQPLSDIKRVIKRATGLGLSEIGYAAALVSRLCLFFRLERQSVF